MVKMEKAYDLEVLKQRLQDRGLNVLEEGAKDVVECTLDFLIESADISPNKVDDMISPFIKSSKPWIMEQVDKVDGKVG